MTKASYLTDCYTKEFSSQVIRVIDGTQIILEDTFFYPTSGGQPNDLGTLRKDDEEYKVIDVVKKDGEIIHIVDRPGISEGESVTGIIDWQRRYTLMRYHTASHILATLINRETGAEITGNQLYTDKARVDFSLQLFDKDLMKGFEEKANEIISKDLPVNFRILDREEAFKIPSLVKLRMQLPESIKEIRIVDIASEKFDFDHQACGGTHLRNTSEIGRMEIFDLENKGKDRRRIYFRLV